MPYKPVFQYLDIGLKIERQNATSRSVSINSSNPYYTKIYYYYPLTDENIQRDWKVCPAKAVP